MSTVLVVDDSLIDRKVITTYLQQAGLSVLNAQNADEAMEQLNSRQLSLIVLDVVMEGKSGFEICRKLKADQKTKSIPVIICSSKSTEADKMLGKMVGADAYFPKPVQQTEFLLKVQELIAN